MYCKSKDDKGCHSPTKLDNKTTKYRFQTEISVESPESHACQENMGTKRNGKYCYICDQFIEKKDFVIHQETDLNKLQNVRFSNDMNDACKTECKVCGKAVRLTSLRDHTKRVHTMNITEYKEKFNQQIFDLVEKILHKCGICGEIFLHDGDCVATHLHSSSHGLTHAEYNAKFMSIKGFKKIVIKKESQEKQVTRWG